MLCTDLLARPQGRSFSKNACLVAQERWNAAIDKYISSSGLSVERKEEIERIAKIGHSNGALYRKCEGVGCSKLEGRDIEKLDCCSKCRMVCLLNLESYLKQFDPLYAAVRLLQSDLSSVGLEKPQDNLWPGLTTRAGSAVSNRDRRLPPFQWRVD